MKLLHYFLAFNAFALSYFLFSQVLCSPDTEVNSWICTCIAFSILSSTAVYNLVQGYKLQKEEY